MQRKRVKIYECVICACAVCVRRLSFPEGRERMPSRREREEVYSGAERHRERARSERMLAAAAERYAMASPARRGDEMQPV